MLNIIKESSIFKFEVAGENIPAKVEFYIKNRRNVFDVYLKDGYEEKIMPAKLVEIPDSTAINFQKDIDWTVFLHRVKISIRNNLILYNFKIDVGRWTEPFSIPEYLNKYIEIVKTSEEMPFELHSLEETSFSTYTKFPLVNLNKTIADEIQDGLAILEKCHKKAISYLLSLSSSAKMQAIFFFPDEIKINCEQYLLYFAHFLRDLGINATPNLKEKAGKVLFSVTPNNNIEALDKIREALAVYLNLPSSPIVYDESFAAMRLQQQIENLEHSQKMAVREIQLAEKVIMIQSETIQEKNVTISQKDSVIEQQNKVIKKIASKSIMMDSLENKEEFEKVFDGLEFGESKELKEKLGIKFNPLISLKTIGNKLTGKNSEITSLNLNEETTNKKD